MKTLQVINPRAGQADYQIPDHDEAYIAARAAELKEAQSAWSRKGLEHRCRVLSQWRDQGWKKTRVEAVCPLDVFKSIQVEDEEMQRLKEEQGLEVLQPEIGSKPRVYYKNLHLMSRCFVSGTVVVNLDGVEDCAEGAEVVLKQHDSEIARATTDIFGEFKIDNLEKQSGPYELEVNSDSYGSVSMEFKLGDESLYLGIMPLTVGE